MQRKPAALHAAPAALQSCAHVVWLYKRSPLALSWCTGACGHRQARDEGINLALDGVVLMQALHQLGRNAACPAVCSQHSTNCGASVAVFAADVCVGQDTSSEVMLIPVAQATTFLGAAPSRAWTELALRAVTCIMLLWALLWCKRRTRCHGDMTPLILLKPLNGDLLSVHAAAIVPRMPRSRGRFVNQDRHRRHVHAAGGRAQCNHTCHPQGCACSGRPPACSTT